MNKFLNEVKKLRTMGINSEVRASEKTLFEDKTRSVDFIKKINIPFLYRRSRYATLNSDQDIEEELELDENGKHRFYFFMRPPLSRYWRIIDALEEMKNSTYAQDNMKQQSLLITLTIIMIALYPYDVTYSILVGLVLIYSIYKKGFGRKVSGLMEAIDSKITYIKKSLMSNKRANYDNIVEVLNEQVYTKIYEKAKKSCGVEESEIIGNNGKAIILQEFAFLQSKKLSGHSKLDQDYITTYWSVESGDLVSSCYYLQYIFMLEDKIETYSTFYDVVQDKQFGKDVQSFYYTDISKISEIEEDIGMFEITKFEIAINSGDKIQINLKNQNTIDEMSKLQKNKDVDSLETGIKEEISDLESELADTEDTEDKEMIQNEIKELKEQMKTISFNDNMINLVESFSKSLKVSVNSRKNA